MKSQMRSRPSFASAPKNIRLLYSLKQRVTVFSIELRFDSRTPGHRQGSPNYFRIPQPNHSSYRPFSISWTDHIHGSANAHTCLLSTICRFTLAHNQTGGLESARTHTGGCPPHLNTIRIFLRTRAQPTTARPQQVLPSCLSFITCTVLIRIDVLLKYSM